MYRNIPPGYDKHLIKPMKVNDRYYYGATIIWAALSFLSGLIVDLFYPPLTFIEKFFQPYIYHIAHYETFCQIMTFIFIFMPFFIIFIWKNGFDGVKLKLKFRIFFLLFTIFLMFFFVYDGPFAFSPVTFSNDTGKSGLIYSLIVLFDWFGASFFLFCILNLLALSITTALKGVK